MQRDFLEEPAQTAQTKSPPRKCPKRFLPKPWAGRNLFGDNRCVKLYPFNFIV